MTNREAIERIKDHMRVHKIGEYPHVHIAEALNMAIAALESTPDWTPCAEGLPKRTGRYNVTILDRLDGAIATDTDTFFANEKQWTSSYERIDERVIGGGKTWRVMSEDELRFINIAWQPLPAPYRAERKED